jgi:Cdc6-like AAA superfamily ATPase
MDNEETHIMSTTTSTPASETTTLTPIHIPITQDRLQSVDAILSQLTASLSLHPDYSQPRQNHKSSQPQPKQNTTLATAHNTKEDNKLDASERPTNNTAVVDASTTQSNKPLGQSSSSNHTQPTHSNSNNNLPYDPLPPNLLDAGEELYLALSNIQTTNVAAWISGPHGSGKTLLVHSTLRRLQHSLAQQATSKHKAAAANNPITSESSTNSNSPSLHGAFRVVYIHSVLTPAQSIVVLVKEINRQLSEAARAQISKSWQEDRWNDPFSQSRETSFTNQIQLLNDILKIAKVDQIPILIILDDLECFTPMQKKATNWNQEGGLTEPPSNDGAHLLLYFLLDRVSTQGSLLSVLGLTTYPGWAETLEKRITSRAEGTGKFIHIGHPTEFSAWKEAILYHTRKTTNESLVQEIVAVFDIDVADNDHANQNSNSNSNGNTTGATTVAKNNAMTKRVHETLKRNWQLGQSIGWLCRVFTIALVTYRYDCAKADNTAFTAEYWWDALLQIGNASILSDDGRRDMVVTKKARTQETVLPSTRCRILQDLVGPQVALLLAARRVLKRESQKKQAKASLTIQGMSSRYALPFLTKASYELLEAGVFRPAQDRVGPAPLQYQGILVRDIEWNTLSTLTLQICVDVHRELDQAIELGILDCSTALREWGRKIN